MRKVSYLPLWHLLLEKGMTKSQMRIEAGLTTNVLAKLIEHIRHIVNILFSRLDFQKLAEYVCRLGLIQTSSF